MKQIKQNFKLEKAVQWELLTSLSILLFCFKHLLNILRRSLLLIFLAVHCSPLFTCYPVPSTSSPKRFLKLLSWFTCDFRAAKAHACAFPVVCSVLSVAFGTDVIPFPPRICSSSPPQFWGLFPTLPISAQCPWQRSVLLVT